MAVINFKCKKCGEIFNFDVGKISFELVDERPQFENEIKCENCGLLTLDEVELTELGQSQLTELQLEEEEKSGENLC